MASKSRMSNGLPLGRMVASVRSTRDARRMPGRFEPTSSTISVTWIGVGRNWRRRSLFFDGNVTYQGERRDGRSVAFLPDDIGAACTIRIRRSRQTPAPRDFILHGGLLTLLSGHVLADSDIGSVANVGAKRDSLRGNLLDLHASPR